MKTIMAITQKCNDKKNNDDIVNYNDIDGGTIFFLADGATGCGRGYIASSIFNKNCLEITKCLNELQLTTLFQKIEFEIMCEGDCDTTGILIQIDTHNNLLGISAGDSEAFLFKQNCIIDLTKKQKKKPRIGSGAYPVLFKDKVDHGDILFIASDGVLNTINKDELFSLIKNKSSYEIYKKIQNPIDDASFLIAY